MSHLQLSHRQVTVARCELTRPRATTLSSNQCHCHTAYLLPTYADCIQCCDVKLEELDVRPGVRLGSNRLHTPDTQQ